MIPANTLGGSSRILINTADGNEVGLAMSRSLGDQIGKKVGLIAEPTIDVLSIKDLVPPQKRNEVFLMAVSCSDGLLDFVSNTNVAQHLAENMYKTSSLEVVGACTELIMRASREWIKMGPYRDDISISISDVPI